MIPMSIKNLLQLVYTCEYIQCERNWVRTLNASITYEKILALESRRSTVTMSCTGKSAHTHTGTCTSGWRRNVTYLYTAKVVCLSDIVIFNYYHFSSSNILF